MATIAELKIFRMFTAYAEDLGHLRSNSPDRYAWRTNAAGLHHYQYYCAKCDLAFSAAWGQVPGALNGCERGSWFICPGCGLRHQKNVVYIASEEAAPFKVRLVVREFKSVVTFEVFSDTLAFVGDFSLNGNQCKEIFRFDIARQTVTFVKFDPCVSGPIEIGSPFDLDIFGLSILRFFTPNSLANSEQKPKLTGLLRILRETVHRKLESHLGHKVSSMFVSPGQWHGTFLLPIYNIAYRVNFPDAPNLPEEYRGDTRDRHEFWARKMIEKFDYVDAVIAQTRQKKDVVTALIETHALPDKPLVRRALTEDPFAVAMLAMAFSLCQNYDHAMQLFYGLPNAIPRGWTRYPEGLRGFLRSMKRLYGEAGIARLACEAQELNLNDCVQLYRQLNRVNKKALAAEKVRLRDLHDWMSLRHKKQNHVNVKFSVPNHIAKRLSMQKDRLKFFLPAESMELLEAGHALHNCVGSYGKAMKDNRLWVVLVTDDRGKLVACLEIRDKELTQAKVDRNKSVFQNTELNNAIVAWARAASIKISTGDVRVPKDKKAKEKIPA